MKRWLCTVTVLIAGAVGVSSSVRAQAPAAGPSDVGPGDQGATLKLPGMDLPRPAPPSANPFAPGSGAAPANPVARLWNNSTPSANPDTLPANAARIALPPSNATDMNKDIEIKADAGPWVVFVMAYTGPKAPEMARKFVIELRGKYKLPAYVYNSGTKEKQKEFERVQALKKQQMEIFRKEGLRVDMPIRVRTVKIEEETGVLIGGFRDYDDALRGVAKIKKLEAPDPKKVDMDITGVAQKIAGKGSEPAAEKLHEASYVNPFIKAFVARNPEGPKQDTASAAMQAEETEALRKINADEPLSLFTCKRNYTLVVKQFNTQFKISGDTAKPKGFLGVFGFGKGEGVDYAYHNAHDLAAAFRKSGLPDTYVLHTKYCSFVTIGGYERPDEPQLVAMQNLLETRFRADAYRPLDMMPRPVPMQVPR